MRAAAIEWLMARLVKVIGVGVGASVLLASCVMVEHRGVKKEKVRVFKQATKTDVQAGKKRAAAESDPDRVLGRYYRD